MNWRHIGMTGLSACIGIIAWHGEVWGLLVLPALIYLWRSATNKSVAFLYLFMYYLGAARGQVSGANLFYGNGGDALWIGIAVWLTSSAVLAALWSTLWGTTWRGVRLISILLILTVPPVGVIGWASPLTAAGMFFPNTGWIGLLSILMTYMVIANNPRPAFLTPFLVLSFTCIYLFNPTSLPDSFVGIDTQFGAAKNENAEGDFEQMTELQKTVTSHARSAPDGALLLLPETVGGDWSINAMWWDRISSHLAKRGQTALIGATKPAATGGYLNILTSIGADPGHEIMQRVPVPISMWRPWDRATHFQGSWFGTGIKTVAGKRVAALICYEQVLVFPIVMSMTQTPDLILAPSNGWWARHTTIPKIERQAMKAWSHLFDIPILFSSNI